MPRQQSREKGSPRVSVLTDVQHSSGPRETSFWSSHLHTHRAEAAGQIELDTFSKNMSRHQFRADAV